MKPTSRIKLSGLLLAASGLAWAPFAHGQPAPPTADVRFQHDGPVFFVGFAHGGKQLVTASVDGHFRVWDIATAKEARRFGKIPAGKEFAPLMAALSPDGKVVALAARKGPIQLWDSASGKELRNLGQPAEVAGEAPAISLAFSPDGEALAVRRRDQTIRVYAVNNGKELHRLGKPSPVKPFGGNYFAWGATSDGSLAFYDDGSVLASASVSIENNQQTGIVQFWSMDSGGEIVKNTLRAPNPFFDIRTGFGVASLAFIRKDKLLLAWASSDGTARLYDAETGEELRRLPAVQQGVYVAFVFSPDRKTLALRTSNESLIRLYDLEKGQQLPSLGDPQVPHAAGSQTFAFSPDGKTIADSAGGKTVRLWQVPAAK